MARKKQKDRAPRKPRRARTSGQAITRRERRIYAEGQVRALTGNIWDAASQGVEGRWYRVSLACGRSTCGCAYHTTGKGCKGMAAVECLVLAEDES
ncbi:MAG: hypothetical protein J4G04_03410, partial [Nitrosopumilaceae archaeon]|nr:hypothetical protein [Nitrosopumilaceae archaeon]